MTHSAVSLQSRGGFVSIMALAVILLMSALSVELARSFVRRQQTEARHVDQVQAALLAQAGLDHAARQFRQNPERTSLADWTPTLPDQSGKAVVTYEWKRQPTSNPQLVNILVELHTADHQMIRARLTGEIPLQETDNSPEESNDSEPRSNAGTP